MKTQAHLGQVPLRGAGWHPRPMMRHPRLSQQNPLVSVNPQVSVAAPISIELGNLPLSIGLFAGSALAFFVQGDLEKGWPKTTGIVAGTILALGGIASLFVKKPASASYGPAPGQSPMPSAAAASSPATQTTPYQAPAGASFDQVNGVIVTPTDFSTVPLGVLQSSFPVRVTMQNPSGDTVSFNVELRGDENPSIGSSTTSSTAVSVTLGPGESRDIDIQMPITSNALYVTSIEEKLTLYKRRGTDSPVQLDYKSFLLS